MIGVRHNGITISVQRWECRKKPVLAVQIENDPCIYKVASFNNDAIAEWFAEILEEFFDGMIGERITDE